MGGAAAPASAKSGTASKAAAEVKTPETPMNEKTNSEIIAHITGAKAEVKQKPTSMVQQSNPDAATKGKGTKPAKKTQVQRIIDTLKKQKKLDKAKAAAASQAEPVVYYPPVPDQDDDMPELTYE